MSSLIVTVAIPTNKYCSELADFLKYCERNFGEAAEILISYSGSGDEDKFKKVEKDWSGDCKFNVVYNPGADMIQNFNHALMMAQGDYFTCIGNDDGVSKYVVEIVHQMHELNIDSLTPATIGFNWEKNNKYPINQFEVSYGLRTYDFMHESDMICKRSGYPPHNMPKVYYGIVRTALARSIAPIFGYPSPDAYAFTKLGKLLGTYHYSHLPLFVGGTSKQSNAGTNIYRSRMLQDRAGFMLANQPNSLELRIGNDNKWLPDYFERITAWPRTIAAIYADLLSKKINYIPVLLRLLISGRYVRLEAVGKLLRYTLSNECIIQNYISGILFLLRRYLGVFKNKIIKSITTSEVITANSVSSLLEHIDKKLASEGDLKLKNCIIDSK